jgi:hypothetical protein
VLEVVVIEIFLIEVRVVFFWFDRLDLKRKDTNYFKDGVTVDALQPIALVYVPGHIDLRVTLGAKQGLHYRFFSR